MEFHLSAVNYWYLQLCRYQNEKKKEEHREFNASFVPLPTRYEMLWLMRCCCCCTYILNTKFATTYFHCFIRRPCQLRVPSKTGLSLRIDRNKAWKGLIWNLGAAVNKRNSPWLGILFRPKINRSLWFPTRIFIKVCLWTRMTQAWLPNNCWQLSSDGLETSSKLHTFSRPLIVVTSCTCAYTLCHVNRLQSWITMNNDPPRVKTVRLWLSICIYMFHVCGQ